MTTKTETKQFQYEIQDCQEACVNNIISLFESLRQSRKALTSEFINTKIAGCDLSDLHWAYKHQDVDTDKLITCYREYMNQSEGKAPTQKQFMLNMEEKMKDPEFLGDIHIILRPGIEYDNEAAYAFIKSEILEKI